MGLGLANVAGAAEDEGTNALRDRSLHARALGVFLFEGIPPTARFISSPYDLDAHLGKKGATAWIGCTVHLTETTVHVNVDKYPFSSLQETKVALLAEPTHRDAHAYVVEAESPKEAAAVFQRGDSAKVTCIGSQ